MQRRTRRQGIEMRTFVALLLAGLFAEGPTRVKRRER